MAWWGKNPSVMQETWVLSLGQEDPLEEGMANHSSIPAWRIPWKEEPSELQAIMLQRVRCDWACTCAYTHTHTHTHTHTQPYCYFGVSFLFLCPFELGTILSMKYCAFCWDFLLSKNNLKRNKCIRQVIKRQKWCPEYPVGNVKKIWEWWKKL